DSFAWLTQAAFKNLDRGQAGVPIALGAGASVGNVALNAPAISRSGDSAIQKIKDVRSAGGTGWNAGWNTGRSGLKWYQRLKEGRVTQVEDIETLLANMKPGAGGNSDKK